MLLGTRLMPKGVTMKRIALFALGMFAMFGAAFAQTPDIDTPVLALPANLRADAGVIKWKPDHTYDTLKPSKNGLVCYDRSGFPTQQPFSLECTAQGNLDRVKQNLGGRGARRQDEVGGAAGGAREERDACQAGVRARSGIT
jgi:hypothetical protein